MSNSNNVEQQCFKRVWKKTLNTVFKNPTNAMIMAETNSIEQVNVNLKRKRCRRRRKKKNKRNICECCMDGTNNIKGLSTLNTNGTLFLQHMPWDCLNTVYLNGVQFANINSLKTFLRYFYIFNVLYLCISGLIKYIYLRYLLRLLNFSNSIYV